MQLRGAQGSVEAAASEMKLGRGARAARRASVRAIAELEARLVEHFGLEESSGHLSEAVRHAPRYYEEAEALRAEHDSLAREMRAVSELVEVSGRSLEAWSEVDWRLDAFARRLKAHERAENEIASQALLEDLGTSG